MVESTPEMDGKRKSLEQQGSPTKLQKKVKQEQPTPNQNKKSILSNTPTPSKKNLSNERTPKQENQSHTEDSNSASLKKQKLSMFAGVKNLEKQNASSKGKEAGKRVEILRAKRAETKKKQRQFFNDLREGKIPSQEALPKLEETMLKIQKRPQLSKTAKKNLRKLKKLASDIKRKCGLPVEDEDVNKLKKQTQKKSEQKPINKSQKLDSKKSKQEKTKHLQKTKKLPKEASDEEDSEEEAEEDMFNEEQTSGESQDEEEKAEESGEEEEDEEEVETDQKESTTDTSKKSKHILFLGNLPYDATEDEVKEHFLKVGKIIDIRLPKDKTTQKSRGFGYIELENQKAYQAALSLHHSTFKNRRINVLHHKGGGKISEKREFKAKHLKLPEGRKEGKFRNFKGSKRFVGGAGQKSGIKKAKGLN